MCGCNDFTYAVKTKRKKEKTMSQKYGDDYFRK